ncbi:MAG: hypothetical protein HYX69_01415 [Planctomycetia bacterium]|nr:hypothetical protein [Planctomycetia bacterium]
MSLLDGRVMLGDTLLFEGRLWVEEPGKGRPAVWKAGFFSPQTLPMIKGECRLELKDGRCGLMSCNKAQPGMTGGTHLQFQGMGPLAASDDQPAEEEATERLELPLSPSELDQFERAARRGKLTLSEWVRDRLSQAAKRELGA